MGGEADRRFDATPGRRTSGGGEAAAAIVDHRPAAVAQRALRRAIHEGPRLSAQRLIMGAGVVQRSVGFEFEIGEINTQAWGPMSGWVRHAKGATMQTFPGYRLTADDDGPDSRLEVIIDPIDEAAPGAAAAAQALGGNVRNTIDVIAAGANPAAPNYVRADQIPGLGGSSWDRYASQVNSAGLIIGQLQMTGGIDMAKLHAHATGAQATGYLATLNPMVNADDALAHATLGAYVGGPFAVTATAQTNALLGGPGVAPASINQLGAVAGMMATVPILAHTAANPIAYAKGAAGPMLARTDFSKILMLLPPDVLGVLTAAGMEQIVLATVNAHVPGGALTAGHPVIPVGALAAGNQNLSGLTIGAWTRGVVPSPGLIWGMWQGKDQLTKKNFPGNTAQRDDVESMGGYGNKVDPGDRPIVEFRNLNTVPADDLGGQLARLIGFINH